MDTMLTAAEQRQPVLLGRRVINTQLVWWRKDGRYIEVATAEGVDWVGESRQKLGRLLEEYGHLVKRCDAPARHSEAKCGTLFLASRPAQKFCSARCQARAATRDFREKHQAPTKKGRKKGRV
jgi:hypothetical protein